MNTGDFYMDDTFIESPIFDNWFKKHYPKNSLLICSPYIKKDAVDKLISLYNLNARDESFDLKVLIRGNENEFTYQKSSDVSAFDSFINIRGFDISNVRRVTNLHMKAYLIDSTYLLITSGNLTNSGMFVVSGKENFEGSISTCNALIIQQFIRYFSHIWNQGDPLENFYDELMSAYTSYIENEYSDTNTFARLNRRRYRFKTRTCFDEVVGRDHPQTNDNNPHIVPPPSLSNMIENTCPIEDTYIQAQTFTLSDIPPVGTLTHLPAVLQYVSEHEDGVTYLSLGKELRALFSDSESTSDVANRKFGEEKSKFAAFLNLVSIEDTRHGKLIKLSKLGKTYLALDDDSKNKLIKDVFFDKPIVVSIMKHSLEDPDFNLFSFLCTNCEGATPNTLARKVHPLQKLFSHISSICTEDELRDALSKIS